ncbi:MAG: hypothetical protein IT244_12075 [Bacteroidia bacterium]|nr:hypothetical protein [Bacteroidia bacterium]
MKNNNWIIALIITAFGVGLLYFFLNNDKKTKHNWNRTLAIENKEPYDLSVFYAALRRTYGHQYEVSDVGDTVGSVVRKLSNRSGTGIYFFAGPRLYFTEKDANDLADFIFDGGNAFISVENIPSSLLEAIPVLKNYSVNADFMDSAFVQFTNISLPQTQFVFVHKVKNIPTPGEWQWFRTDGPAIMTNGTWDRFQSNDNVVVISNIEQKKPDFISVKYGDGQLFLQLNPVFFSNLNLKTETGRKYLSAMLLHLPKDELVFHKSAAMPRSMAQSGFKNRSVFAFIHQHKSLNYAWWILLAGTGLFLVIGGKRKQRSIPVIAAPVNNTMGLVDTVGAFYFKEKNHPNMYKKEWLQLQNFVRVHFRIQLEADAGVAVRLAEKSGVSEKVIQDILDMHKLNEHNFNMTAKELLQCSKIINKFYLEYHNKYGK